MVAAGSEDDVISSFLHCKYVYFVMTVFPSLCLQVRSASSAASLLYSPDSVSESLAPNDDLHAENCEPRVDGACRDFAERLTFHLNS